MLHRHHCLSHGNLLCYLPVILSSPTQSQLHNAFRSTPTMRTTPRPQPPVAKKVEHLMEMFGDVRVDNFYWLRDDSRSDPDVLSYLQKENAYTHSLMSCKKFNFLSFFLVSDRLKKTPIFIFFFYIRHAKFSR